MKQITSLLVVAMFLISLAPMAFAEQGQGTTNQVGTSINEAGEGEAREQFRSRSEQLREDLLQQREEARSNLKRDRVNIMEKHAEFRERYRENRAELSQILKRARERKEIAIAKQELAKTQLEATRGKLAQCKDKANVECTELRKQARKQSYNFLLNTADRVLTLLEKTKERVQNSDLAEEEKAEIIAKIDERIEEAASSRETVELITENASKEEIKDAAKTIRESWKEANKNIRKGVAKVASMKIGGILVKIQRLQVKLDKIVDRLESKGKDTSAIEAVMADFDAKIADAEAAQAQVKAALFETGKASEAVAYVKESHKSIKEARILLKDAVLKIRKVNQGQPIGSELEPETQTELEAEQEDEEAEDAESEDTEEEGSTEE
jgi:hypothetical protein